MSKSRTYSQKSTSIGAIADFHAARGGSGWCLVFTCTGVLYSFARYGRVPPDTVGYGGVRRVRATLMLSIRAHRMQADPWVLPLLPYVYWLPYV